MFACASSGAGGRPEAAVALQGFVQIELLALLEAVQYKKQQEGLQGSEQNLQKRLQSALRGDQATAE
jgi:hypothetical protein